MTTLVQKRPAVRAPFRFLAAVVGLVAVVAILGTGYMAWHGDRALQVKDVVMLPGVLWLGRLMLLATFLGKVVPKDRASGNEYWPFPSAQVAACYWLLVVCFF